jgi:hypothetical protein
MGPRRHAGPSPPPFPCYTERRNGSVPAHRHEPKAAHAAEWRDGAAVACRHGPKAARREGSSEASAQAGDAAARRCGAGRAADGAGG